MPTDPKSPETTKSEAEEVATRTYGFDLLYLTRFASLHPVLFPGVLSFSSLLFLSLLGLTALEQFLAYLVGLVSGQYYKVTSEIWTGSVFPSCLNSFVISRYWRRRIWRRSSGPLWTPC